MKAAVHRVYGPPDVLHIEDVARPVPRDGEVLIKVHATTVSRSDAALRAGEPFISRFITGLRRPKRTILGSDVAGEVESVGGEVTEFKVGDRVFGINPWRFGAHAEFMSMSASGALATMPAGLPFDEAAAIADGAILALNALRPARLHRGHSILIYGASGSIGSAAVQLAKFFGAHVTGVCLTPQVEFVHAVGADDVINSNAEDFTKNGPVYDAILDAVGNLTFKHCRDALKSGGVYLATDGLRNIVLSPWTSVVGDKRVRFSIPPRFTKQDVVFLRSMIEAGKYHAVIDRRYALDEVVAATRYVETKHKTGNVVLMVSSEPTTS